VFYSSNNDISGVQFALSSDNSVILSAAGGLFEELGFNVVLSQETNILIAFSMDGGVIPAGEGILTNLTLEASEGAEICIFDAVVSDPSATELIILAEGCSTISFVQFRPGDFNADGETNVFDIVQLVNIILTGGIPSENQLLTSDMNEDGSINVVDIIQIVNVILSQRSTDATEARLIKAGNALNLNADGFIGGVQMTLSHGADFSIELTDKAMVADYRTNGNETTLIIVAPEGDELFIADGKYDIVEMIVANSAGRMDVSVVPDSFVLSQAYPNPFNPSTTINLSIPEAGYASVMVYNVIGQLVSTLADGHMDASDYSLTWDASSVPSGVYFITASTVSQVSTQKVMLLK
jgi:hypothetical protein